MTDTTIQIKTGQTEVELSGSREFVDEYLRHLRALGRIPGQRAQAAATGGLRPAGAANPDDRSADAFLRRIGVNPQAALIPDLIVYFGYYVTRIQRRPSFTMEDLEFHFAHAGVRAPKSLASALGGLRRKRAHIDRGDTRGTYTLTPAGIRFVQNLIPR